MLQGLNTTTEKPDGKAKASLGTIKENDVSSPNSMDDTLYGTNAQKINGMVKNLRLAGSRKE